MDPNSSFAVCRIDDGDDGADAVSVITDDAGNVVGFSVEVLVLTGAFANMRIVAALTAPVGSELPDLPQPGTTLLVAFTNHTPDTGAYIVGQVPGGTRAIPKATAGIAVSDDGLGKVQVRMPPKGVGVRHYVRGAPYVIRLKGAQEGYAGELYIEADDQADSPDGNNGTFIRIMRDPTTSKFAFKARDATGASFTLLNGIAVMSSPDNSHQIRVGNDGIFISGKNVVINGESYIRVDGLTLINMPPVAVPTPANAAIYGPSGASGVPSLKTFIGS